MKHSKLVGRFFCYCVNRIKRKVEFFLVMEFNLLQIALAVGSAACKFVADIALALRGLRRKSISYNFLFFLFARHNYCKEFAVLAVNGYHTVRR